ncbi:MAG: sigma-70 family RNA polymerase sigma factor [Flavobacteriales bacterium]|nr:sigma-70 family RNA polymerase sigma factor [Flavobacteriales bacterium]MCB9448518.1 sigma-70 family RNA polymerase sigma factor [Flavobacteriales bacterium]
MHDENRSSGSYEQSMYHMERGDIEREWEEIRAAQQDNARFEVLYDRYYERIFRFVYQRVDEMQTASDITSQVFFKAMVHLKDYTFKGTPFSAWLFRIATNELNMEFRRNKTNRSVNIESISDIQSIIESSGEDYTEEKMGKLIKVLGELKEDELEMVDMRFFEKRSYKEIGQVLAISENNAKVKVHRVLKKLAKLITNYNASVL